MINRYPRLLAAIGAAAAAPALPQTVTVTTTQDDSDFGGAMQVSDLPGPDGRVSFRVAATAANNTPGPQTNAFAVPTNSRASMNAQMGQV